MTARMFRLVLILIAWLAVRCAEAAGGIDWTAWFRSDDTPHPGAVVLEYHDGAIERHAFGTHRAGGDRAVTPESRFEIGSITKVFNNLLLAELVARNVVAYDTTIAELLPEARFENPAVGRITLLDLATHRSGLPRLPANLDLSNRSDPYAGYDSQKLIAALENARAGQTLAQSYSYSNFGHGALGWLLGEAAGSGWFGALARHILDPLGLDTVTRTCPDRAAHGHAGGEPVPYWSFDALAAAGTLCATAGDVMRVARLYLDADTVLMHDLSADLDPVRERTTRVWHLAHGPDSRTVYWHNGGTGGFASFVGLDPEAGRAVVILANGAASVTPAGLRALAAGIADLNAASGGGDALAEYAGTYRLGPSFEISVFVADGGLRAQGTGQPPLTLVEAGPDRFSVREVDAAIRFERDADGKVRRLVLVQNGREQSGQRVAGSESVD